MINVAEGDKQEAIKKSEGEKTKRINEAEGRAKEIEVVAHATAEGIRKIAESINLPGGGEAVNLRVAEQYIREFGNLAKENNTVIIPSNLSDIGGMVASVTNLIKSSALTDAESEPHAAQLHTPGARNQRDTKQAKKNSDIMRSQQKEESDSTQSDSVGDQREEDILTKRRNNDLALYREDARRSGRALSEELKAQRVDSEYAAVLIDIDRSKPVTYF